VPVLLLEARALKQARIEHYLRDEVPQAEAPEGSAAARAAAAVNAASQLSDA
jgi:hypothetical protein